MKYLSIILCFIISSLPLFSQTPIYNNFDPSNPANPDVGLLTSIGSGFSGLDESVLQDVSLGMNILGFGGQISAGNSIADDFSIPADVTITTVEVFAYQTGADAMAETIDQAFVRIWDGVPGDVGSNIIFGDMATDRFVSVSFSGMYRVTESTMGFSNRAIQRVILDVPVALSAGTYWLEYSLGGSSSFSGPWFPPITIAGNNTTGDAYQTLDGSIYDDLVDTGSFTQQGLPFIINGTALIEVPTLGQWGIIILGLLLLITAVTAISRRQRIAIVKQK